MGRTKAVKRKIGGHSKDDMMQALQLIKDGASIRRAAKECHLAYPTLRRYAKKIQSDENTNLVPNYEVNAVFSQDQELVLKDYIKQCALMFYGLGAKEVRQVAYQMAKTNKIKTPISWEANGIAGKDWLRSFRARHQDLSLKKPEPCSLARATAFNRDNVEKFFSNLKEVMQRHHSFGNGMRVYNLDETSTTTVQKPQKVLAPKGFNVCKITSGERGVLITTCAIISASGQALPPAMVFPRKNFKTHMLHGAPPGTLGLAAPSGWMNVDLFVDVMKHFVKHTSSSKDNPSLLILDNHESHLSIQALDLAKNSGVTVLTLPPHTTAKLQPLDVGLNAPFKCFYNAAVDSWLLRNPGQMLTIYHVAECVGQAYLKSMTPVNITNAFRKCGIHPFDDSIFTDVDFLPSSVTDRPDPELTISEPTEEQDSRACASPSLLEMTQDNSEIILSLFEAQEKTLKHDGNCSVIDTAPQKPLYVPSIATSDTVAQPQKYDNQLDIPSTSRGQGTFISPSVFRPPIKAGPRKIKKRRKLGRSMIATDTPEKNEIENKKKACTKNVKKRDIFKEKKTTSIDCDSTSTTDEEIFVASGSSSGGEDFISDEEEGEIILTENFLPLPREPKVGDYVIILLETEKKNKLFYIARIIEEPDQDDCDYYVSFLKLKSKVYHKFSEPLEPDCAGVRKIDIKYILPKPKVDGSSRRQATFKFPVNISLLKFTY
ncbi:uncharacterized protein [Epargyreus clarus]|uniref:uncharacterized protein n=1 Tax=Epargyreus clarus TaxID=520877 RepID=UPI003C2DD488